MVLLITGTAGFIGFNLARKLLEEGHTVVGVDNLNDYYCVDLKKKRHALLAEFANFFPAEIDLCDLPALEDVFKSHSPEVVCNLAAQAGVRYSLVNPFVYQKSNIEGFINVIELSKRAGVKRFVYASSSSVYGGVKELPFVEDQRLDTPISLYGATKKSNELIAHTYTHLFNLQTVGLRFFTVYGPWGRPDMAVWIFSEAILAEKPIQVFNYGKMTRDFTFVDDIISGTAGALFAENLAPYSIFNLGNHKSENLTYMIELLENALGKKAHKEMMPIQSGDVPATYADIANARKFLGFDPKTSLDEGIKSFVDWYLANGELAEKVKRLREREI